MTLKFWFTFRNTLIEHCTHQTLKNKFSDQIVTEPFEQTEIINIIYSDVESRILRI